MERIRVKTNNSYLGNKVDLRINHIPENPVVLDCFGGAGIIWKAIERATGKPIKRIGIDKIDYGVGFFLEGDNMAFLKTIDLSKFNVIDLDAYGAPYQQLKTLFDRRYSGVVFVTFIQGYYGIMPKPLLNEIGFTDAMIEKCPTIFGKRGWQYFLEWLALNGVRTVTHRSHNRKHYLAIRLNGAASPGADCRNPQGENLASPS